MSEQDPTIWQAIGGGIMAILGWLGVRQVNRIDNIERNYVSRNELNGKLDKLHEDVREIRNHILNK